MYFGSGGALGSAVDVNLQIVRNPMLLKNLAERLSLTAIG